MLQLFILSLIPAYIFIIIRSLKALHMLQQNWYNDGNRYLKWIFNNYNKVFVEIDVFFVIFIGALFTSETLAMCFFGLFYLTVAYLFYTRNKKEQIKKPLVITKRIRRLLITMFILYLIPTIGFVLAFDISDMAYYYLVIGSLIYLNYFVVMLANIVNKPIEKFVFNYYKKQSMKKLKKMNNMQIIGITGSYGKTSSKNIVNDILNVKYNAMATPQNFNTTYGIIRTINNYLDKFTDSFIVEMGAFKRGEIKEICNLVNPKYGIITKIGTAHLESFKTRENIQKTKFELIESLPKDGVGILNKDDDYQLNYQLKNNCKIIWIGIENKDVDVRADNIKLSHLGTTFDCYFKGDKVSYQFETKLLGNHNVYNVLAGIALGKELGLSIEQLQIGVKRIKTIEHRLELKKYGNINIIDDAYNSNPVGSKMALDVLKLMPGKKIIVTPGMIELGELQYEANLEFGKQIAETCDEVILVGKEQTKPIYDGLMVADYDETKVHIINDVKVAFPLMNKLSEAETYVLLENDLPDIFNE